MSYNHSVSRLKEDFRVVLFLIILAVLIIGAWISVVFVQVKGRLRFLGEEKFHNIQYLELVKHTMENSIDVKDGLRHRLEQKFDTIVEQVDTQSLPTKKMLESLAKDYNVLDILIITEEKDSGISSSDLLQKNILKKEKFFRKRNRELIKWRKPEGKSENYFSKVHKKENFYIIITISEEIFEQNVKAVIDEGIKQFVQTRLHAFCKRRGNHHIKYVVFQDYDQIIASTPDIKKISSVNNDKTLIANYNNFTPSFRIIDYNEKKILEVYSAVKVKDHHIGIIRIATDLDRFHFGERKRVTQNIMFSVIFLSALILELLFYRKHRKLNIAMEKVNQAQRTAEIAKLGGEVAHEIRNPLNSIYMILQRLKSEFEIKDNRDEYDELINISQKETQRLNEIIENFLKYSKKTAVNFNEEDLSSIINEVLRIFSSEIEKNSIEVETDIPDNLKLMIDGKKIKQVIINLVKNSIESFVQGSKKKLLSIEVVNQNKKIKILISDNGKGISDKEAEKIWEIYFTTKDKGNGLGLAISKKIIEAHNGKIYFKKNQKNNTTFVIELPNKIKS